VTLPANPDLVSALRKIGQGLLDLAAAIDIAPEAAAKPDPRPTKSSSPKPAPSSAEEPQKEELKLSTLQVMAKDLLKKEGGRKKLEAILDKHELETVSSAPEEKWPDLKVDLGEALGE
jgi:hypothetical protein